MTVTISLNAVCEFSSWEIPAPEMTYTVSGGALNSTQSNPGRWSLIASFGLKYKQKVVITYSSVSTWHILCHYAPLSHL